MLNTTETSSTYQNLDKMPVSEILASINQEDKTVPLAVEKCLPQIEKVVNEVVKRLQNGGRLFYIGAGTSGRLGVVDASECPPTFGVDFNKVIGIIAGGDTAIRKAVEFAEDNTEQAWIDLQAFEINSTDALIGIAASGRTPYVIGGVKKAKEEGIYTACICCNAGSALANEVNDAIEVVVGPEFLTGSTRMKAGTAQKLVLNMITTATMIQLGHVKGNKMVDMQLSNYKLIQRAVKMLIEELPHLNPSEAEQLLQQHGNVRKVLNALGK